MLGKKGISPLIATVLLIAFAVALGAMIMNWSTDIQPVDDTTDKTPSKTNPCQDVRLELNQVFGKQILCYQDNEIRFNVVNTGSKEISGIQVRTVDPSLKELKEIIPNSRMPVGETFEHRMASDASGKLHVELVPFVVDGGEPQYCVNQRIVRDVLPDCANE